MPALSAYRPIALSCAYRARVLESLRMLEELPKLGACVVSTSWGKDSVVMMDLARRAWSDLHLLHLEDPFEYPGYEKVREFFLSGSRYHEITNQSREKILAEFCERGLWHDQDPKAQQAQVDREDKDFLQCFAEDHGYQVVLVGLRSEENQRTRGVMLRSRGATFQRRSGLWQAHPLADWTARDIWAYICERKLPYNRKLYDAETHGRTRESIRNTAYVYTYGAANHGTCAWLRHHFPDQWLDLCREFPEMTSYA